LHIRRKRSANVRSFIPMQSKPAQIFDNGVPKFRRATIMIEIFDTEDQLSAVLVRAFLRPPESNGVAEMKITRGRRSNAATIGNFRFQISDLGLA
jgi:hypothetical protein